MTEFVPDEIDFSQYMRETDLTMGFATLESERSLVSILMNFPDKVEDCNELTDKHFTSQLLRDLFAQIRAQVAVGYDVVTLGAALPQYELAEIHAVSQCNDYSHRSLARHIAIVIDAYKSRKLFEIAEMMRELALDKTPVQMRIDKATSALNELDGDDCQSDWTDAYTSAIEHLAVIERRGEGKSAGIATGIHDFDEILDGGFQPGNLVVIGARPSMGKSALGLTIGLHISQSHHVGFISMEMSREDVSDRQAAILGGVALSKIKRPQKGLEFDRIVDAVERSKFRKFYVVDQGGLNILQVRSRAKALKRRKGLDVLIVDYIGLMSGLDSKMSRAYQIEEISRGFKSLAKELGIVIICLAQVNRAAAEGDKAPGLHELRDSGAIEQDADVVGFIHRPIMAKPDIGKEWEHYALLRVAKNRQGRCGDVHLYYEGEKTRFYQLEGQPPTKTIGTARRGL